MDWPIVKRLNLVWYEICPHPIRLRKKNRLLPFYSSESDDFDRLSRLPQAKGELTLPGDKFAKNSYSEEEDDDDEEEVVRPTRINPIR